MESVAFAERKDLAAQVKALSLEAFEEDAVATLKAKKGERIAVALTDDDEVVGYASYAIRPHQRSLNINKLAVSGAHRRKGFGRAILRFLIQLAKRPAKPARSGGGGGSARAPSIDVVCLSSMPSAIEFYKHCGFRADPHIKFPEEDADDLIEGQMYMEFRVRKRSGK